METLFERSNKLIKQANTGFYRYMYNEVNWENRLIGLTGPRGVGKTTMLLQYIQSTLPLNQTLYVTTEDFYFTQNSLLDLADTFVKAGGKYLFIDEIHKYNDWSRDLKDRKSTRLNSSHVAISYAVFCSKKKIYQK